MESIEKHIEVNKEEISNPQISSQRRRHLQEELNQLEEYTKKHPNDHHDPTTLELYCEDNPNALECRIYED